MSTTPQPKKNEPLQRIQVVDQSTNYQRFAHVPFLKTSVEGIVITADYVKAQADLAKAHGALWLVPVLTHAPSGWKICGPFINVDQARKVAGALASLADWTQPKEAVQAQFCARVGQHVELMKWFEAIVTQ